MVLRLDRSYLTSFRDERPGYPAVLSIVGAVLERIADTAALYHNTEHNVMVTLVGQEIRSDRRVGCQLDD